MTYICIDYISVKNRFAQMTALQAYLQNSKTRKVLSKKPGEAGFSLIELVVVVAVLAILSAIAIPAFTSINDKARASAAANTVATIAKQCAANYANGETAPTFNVVSLDGYSSFTSLTGTTSSTTACLESGTLIATTSNDKKYPTFTYNFLTGAKTCTVNSLTSEISVANAAKVGCKGVVSGNGTW